MFGLGYGELLIVFAIWAIFFGAYKLPELGRGIGKDIGNFKQALSDRKTRVESSRSGPGFPIDRGGFWGKI
jgi:sec-independent protein translocase protein TatA